MEGKSYDAAFFQRALSKAYSCPNLSIEEFSINVVTPSGANFCSIIYRVALEFRRSSGSPLESGKYIIKDLLPVAADLGSKEQYMFEKILPEMESILEKAHLGEHKLSAKCFFADVAPGKEIYILEDLGALGYTSLNRFQGLSTEEAKVCLKKIAQFHGASKVLCEEQPDLVAKLSPSHYTNGISDPVTSAILLDGTTYVADLFAAELPEISRKMKAQIPEIYSNSMQKVVDPKLSNLNTIIHGDTWLNNIMVNRKEEKAVLLDFQGSFFGSPAIDLHFFFYTSLQSEDLFNRQDELLDFYFRHFTDTLKECKFKGQLPTFGQLQDEMHRCLYYGYFSAVCEFPTCRAPPEATDGFDVKTFLNPEEMLKKRGLMYANEEVRQRIKKNLIYFDRQGILETP
ncbi:uncharacterized protein Dana_GF15176 [Drosophila ananassae]|uniref:CHK kinase-like domain-containing protein n=1 Tax=Drosophila ananassae TaxID=7217 RepID=B3MNB2_DROAN|nr:uncharacterized protein LOC6497989 [Drosophila ananassae]EDV31069.1 uncharacterized protein Dana_GF15176 [Drosophila ananassae]